MSIPNPFRPVCGKPGGGLPPGYSALNYIAGTGQQCMNIGDVNWSYGIGVDIDFSCDSNTTTHALYGNYLIASSGENRRISCFCGINSQGKKTISVVNDMLKPGYDRFEMQWSSTDKIRIAHNYLGSRTGFIDINGNKVCEFLNLTGDRDWHENAAFCLLSRRDDEGRWEECLDAKIYRAKVSVGSNVWRDLRPALRTADNKPGMYDMVGGNFYTNAGTGEFSYA